MKTINRYQWRRISIGKASLIQPPVRPSDSSRLIQRQITLPG